MAKIDSNYKYLTYDEMAKNVAEKALDEFKYYGKSIREWMRIIASSDAISRQAVFDLPRIKTHNVWGNVIKESVDVEDIRRLSSVNLQEPKTDTLDKIRAEIEKKHARAKQMSSVLQMNAYTDCLQIIDKYKAESE